MWRMKKTKKKKGGSKLSFQITSIIYFPSQTNLTGKQHVKQSCVMPRKINGHMISPRAQQEHDGAGLNIRLLGFYQILSHFVWTHLEHLLLEVKWTSLGFCQILSNMPTNGELCAGKNIYRECRAVNQCLCPGKPQTQLVLKQFQRNVFFFGKNVVVRVFSRQSG